MASENHADLSGSASHSAYAIGFQSFWAEGHWHSLDVEGELPTWLSGKLIRTTPSAFEVGQQSYRHWFDGLAMLHGFNIHDGRVAYGHRFLRSQTFQSARTTGKIPTGEFATDPCYSLFGKMMSWFQSELTDNCNVNVAMIAGEHLALTETRLPVRFDPETLETLGVHDLSEQSGDSPKGPVSSAHPHFDPERGLHYNYVIEFGRKSKYHVFSIDAVSGKQQLICEIDVDRPAYMHSFAMTQRYLVFTEFPLCVHPLKLRFRTKPFIRNYEWRPDRRLRIFVVDKETGGVVQRAETDPMFSFHHVNAFERGNDIVMDLIAYPDAKIIESFYLQSLRSPQVSLSTGHLTRLILSREGVEPVRREVLSDHRVELPRINYQSCAGKDYRFAYFAGNTLQTTDADFINCLIKLDLQSGQDVIWHQASCYPGEPVFVKSDTGQAEDAGVILSIVLDATVGRSFLLVLDAATFQELARVDVPHPIPFGFHGAFTADEQT